MDTQGLTFPDQAKLLRAGADGLPVTDGGARRYASVVYMNLRTTVFYLAITSCTIKCEWKSPAAAELFRHRFHNESRTFTFNREFHSESRF
jgi:hypothetical protein